MLKCQGSATISKRKIPAFRDDPNDDSQTEGIKIVADVTPKELAKAQREVNHTQARGWMPICEIMSHDLLESSPLFDGTFHVMQKKPHWYRRSRIIIFFMMSKPSWIYHDARAAHVIVDFMSSMFVVV